jgi:hypothetical protein
MLFMFLGFLSTPTIMALNDEELTTIIINEEEEHENHSSKVKFNEEEIKAIHSPNFTFFLTDLQIFHNHQTGKSLFDDLVIKIPSPPPEYC